MAISKPYATLSLAAALAAATTGTLLGATPTVEQALQLTPLQDVEYEVPTADEIPKCSIRAEKINGATGWVVYGPAGEKMRQFVDSNGDNKVDMWAYYNNGIEVYRDLDTDFNSKADQYRWLATGGSRWGFDNNEDGVIDRWEIISPEEVSAEIVAAIRDKDVKRFQALLLTDAEAKELGLGKEKAAELLGSLNAAANDFNKWAGAQTAVKKGTKWVHFGATRPGIVPAGADGATMDLLVYENVAAVVETAGEHSQIDIGTLVKLGNSWKVIAAPRTAALAENASQGFFFQASFAARRPDMEGAPGRPAVNAEMQKLLDELEGLDEKQAMATTAAARQDLTKKRVALMEELAAASGEGESRDNWVRQMADVISAGVQTGEYPDGMTKLIALSKATAKAEPGSAVASYVEFRRMSADYTSQLQDPNANFTKVQDGWLESLEGFVKAYPKSDDAAEAMLQLAIANEFAGEEDKAKAWYAQIHDDFPGTPIARKADGSLRRLNSVGKTIQVAGKTLGGKQVNLAALKGRVVLVHFWATWCEPCKQDQLVLRQLQAKYGRKGFELIGVSLDSDKSELTKYMAQARLTWPQIYEDGGLDSPLATDLGVLTLPTMFLVGADGKVISRNIHVSQLDSELGKLLK
ncbi:redoxin family protein [Blastopirellula retiformator]|uniref:Thiol-disulfide oxidoreductase ResA n=1 Tax=Blastopirellula retiformator TaxID=2527970 RepID=A0A5C5V741_9BACT|nr:redoxin family protein [Blastopirellula retiformator]TWT34101.1 Thiol-disulfide oxidoreductase ResA [Blastopirellula retiformator]